MCELKNKNAIIRRFRAHDPNVSDDNFSRLFQTVKQLNITYRRHRQRLIVLLGVCFFPLLFYLPQKYARQSQFFLFDLFLSPPARLPCVPFGSHLLTQSHEMMIASIINACATRRHTIVFDDDDDVERTKWEMSSEGKCICESKEATGTTTSSYCCHWFACLCVVFTVAQHYTTFGLLFIAQIHLYHQMQPNIVFKCLWAHTLTRNRKCNEPCEIYTLHVARSARRNAFVWR